MGISRIGQALTARDILQLVENDMRRMEEVMRLESIASVDAISAINRHIQASGGKRLRPTLVLLSTNLFGPVSDLAVSMAAVVEMIHTATLVHDDVIDAAETRRGKPSTNALWGNNTSVLAGDWLYMQAFQVAIRARNFRILDLLIGLTQLMVEGELLQLERIGKIDITEADYMELIDRKTAGLFSTCARLGAMTGGASEEDESKLGEFAWNLGIAFQLVDDILDFTSREMILGKPVGNDLREGKVTLPLLYALRDANAQEREMVATVVREQEYKSIRFEQVIALLRKYQGIERARERAEMFTERARSIIQTFPESQYQRALLSVTDLVTARDH
jgi:octaprenyl-diphosphate synthase